MIIDPLLHSAEDDAERTKGMCGCVASAILFAVVLTVAIFVARYIGVQ